MNRLALTLLLVLVAGVAGAQVTAFPAAGPTRVSQAANLSTSALHTAAVATDLLFAPANNTEYRIHGKLFVSSETNTGYAGGFQFVAPATDAIKGSCTVDIPDSIGAGATRTAPLVAGATSASVLGVNSPAPLSTPVVFTLNCYLSTTTTTSGNFAVLFGGENALGTYILYAKSYIDYEALP